MPKYRVIYKQTVTLSGEVEANCLEAVFENEIICLGPGGKDILPEVEYISIEKIGNDSED